MDDAWMLNGCWMQVKTVNSSSHVPQRAEVRGQRLLSTELWWAYDNVLLSIRISYEAN